MPETASQIRPAGRSVELFNDQLFSELRAYAQIPDHFLNSGWDLKDVPQRADWSARTANVGSLYMVKELSVAEHRSLLQIAGSYGKHVRSGETLLCPMYLHFKDTATGRFFFAQRNCIGLRNMALYELKGCGDRMLEKDGELVPATKRALNLKTDLPVTNDQREHVLRCIRRDVDWLAKRSLTDYSLLVAIREEPVGLAAGGTPPSMAQRPLVQRGGNIGVYLSLGDFLQKWTMKKRVAHAVALIGNRASLPPPAYAKRFLSNVSERLTAISADAVPPISEEHLSGWAPPPGDMDDPDFADSR